MYVRARALLLLPNSFLSQYSGEPGVDATLGHVSSQSPQMQSDRTRATAQERAQRARARAATRAKRREKRIQVRELGLNS